MGNAAPSFDILGYDHIKVALKDPERYELILKAFGFSAVSHHPDHLNKPRSVYGSGDAFFVIYPSDHPTARMHHELHGDTVFDLSFLVKSNGDHPMLFEGVGKMKHSLVTTRTFAGVPAPFGILKFDHNTLNVERGEMSKTVDYYLQTFGFEKGQYFDIKGQETGLYSWVTRAPNKTVQIPFNESQDDKSQIQEFIKVHKGGGVQHIALLTPNVIQTMERLRDKPTADINFLTIPDTYYEIVSQRYKIRESFEDLKRLRIQVDADKKGGYLLQIFTGVLFGGFFFELIQREGNEGFGEGNFQALFESMELDQKRRGVL